jgi:hypothetical protein
MSELELETKFEKINLEEGPCRSKEESGGAKCECRKIIAKALEHTNTGSSLQKVKERRKNLIKPARLKLIGTCWARKARSSSVDDPQVTEETRVPSNDLDTFATEAFLKMRITPSETLSHPPSSPSDEKTSPASSQPNSCSAQAKLQQQFSSSEFDSTIDEMSEILAYHLKLYPQDKNYLVDSMYT